MMIIILMISTLIIDLISKIIVVNNVVLNDIIVIINNFLYVTYVRNTGVAWSIFSGRQYMIQIISVLIIGAIS